jgi:diguanylate cyclase (GGDEF)-like protein
MRTGKKRAPLSLRARLFILLCTMVLPFVAFSVFKAWDINRVSEAEHQRQSLALAQSVAYSIDDYEDSTIELLEAVASSNAAVNTDYEAMTAWFEQILPRYPHFSNIIYVDNAGDILAQGLSSKDATGVINVSDTVYYQRAMAADGSAVGDFMYGKISGTPVVHMCYPVKGPDGKRTGFVAAAMHLTRVQDRLMREQTPDHTVISVISSDGTMIARNHDPEDWVGQDVTESMRVEKMRQVREGEDEITLPDGSDMLCAFVPVEGLPWFVRVGVNRDAIRAEIRTELATHFAVFTPLLLIALLGFSWIGRDVDRLHHKTEQMSQSDALTELWNYRKLLTDMTSFFAHASRTGEKIAFVMIDLDDFKQYNDRFGHQAGDRALRLAGRAVEGALRTADIAYRYGGEEFSALLPDTGIEGALQVAERIRVAIEQLDVRPPDHPEPIWLTASLGVATYPDDASDPEELIKLADVALYRAKGAGKNRVESCRPAHVAAPAAEPQRL